MATLTQTLADSKTAVRYDRSRRLWLAVNGTTQEFPAGPDGKRAALLTALTHDHPALAAIVTDLAAAHDNEPALVDRLIKAAQLLVHGHVYTGGRVQSQTDDTIYTTRFDGIPHTLSCDCADHDHGLQKLAGLSAHGAPLTAWGIACKHSLAAHVLAPLAGLELPTEPIPF